MINYKNIVSAARSFKNSNPFNHCVVDNFLDDSVANTIENDFIEYESDKWFYYKNPIEDKKTINHWDKFPKTTYQLFTLLNSDSFLKFLGSLLGIELYADTGLHGGGWHCHTSGGNLNPHLDYSIHPKLGLQRKINIILYVSSNMKPEYGGQLGLWSGSSKSPEKLEKEIDPLFNRAVIFDTTQNSWHGMSKPLVCPEGVYRKSLAVYYLCKPASNVDPRTRALFALREDQKNSAELNNFIRARAGL